MHSRSSLLFLTSTALLLACGADPASPVDAGMESPVVDAGHSEVDAAQPQPGFILSLAADKLPVLQGSRASVTVRVTRERGFAEAIAVSAEDLPSGVSAEDLTIAADEDEATLELVATAAAPHSLPTEVTVRGVAGEFEDEQPLTVTVYGPPGSLDTSFADGKVIMPAGAADDYAHALAVQEDGKLVVAGASGEQLGDIAVFRLERDGDLDRSFGDAGLVTTSVGTGGEVAYAVAVQSDGKIVVAGAATSATTGRDFVVVRYTADGSLDEEFGDGGVVVTPFTDDSDAAYAIALQPDGKIVVGGEANQGSSSTGVDFALARYLEDGTLDESFGEGGKVVTSLAAHGGRDTIYALALQEVAGEVRIVAAGGEGDFMLARYHEDGAIDTSFGDQGKLVGLFGSTIGAARGVQIDGDGRLVVAGHSHHDFAVVRLDASGELDPDFGDGGQVLTQVSETNWDEARGLAIEDGNAILVGGFVYEGNTSAGDFALVRYREDGALDPEFGDGGIVITAGAAANKRDEATAVLLQRDERVPTVRVVLAGSASMTNSDFAVTRYWR